MNQIYILASKIYIYSDKNFKKYINFKSINVANDQQSKYFDAIRREALVVLRRVTFKYFTYSEYASALMHIVYFFAKLDGYGISVKASFQAKFVRF